MSDPMDEAMQETRERVEAAARVREAVERAEHIGNPSMIANVGDVRAVLDFLAAAKIAGGDKAIIDVNEWVDRMVEELDRDLPGIGPRARAAWDQFEESGGSAPATLPGQALTMVRIGFIGGYVYGWFQHEEQTR
jgi:hypothetical protein